MGRKIFSNTDFELTCKRATARIEKMRSLTPLPKQKRRSKNQLQAECDQDVAQRFQLFPHQSYLKGRSDRNCPGPNA